MNGARLFAIVLLSIMAGTLALAALAKPSVFYDPSALCRVLCGLGAFTFSWELYSMISGNDESGENQP